MHSDNTAPQNKAKKAYETPVLNVHGKVSDLTQGTLSIGNDSGKGHNLPKK